MECAFFKARVGDARWLGKPPSDISLRLCAARSYSTTTLLCTATLSPLPFLVTDAPNRFRVIIKWNLYFDWWIFQEVIIRSLEDTGDASRAVENDADKEEEEFQRAIKLSLQDMGAHFSNPVEEESEQPQIQVITFPRERMKGLRERWIDSLVREKFWVCGCDWDKQDRAWKLKRVRDEPRPRRGATAHHPPLLRRAHLPTDGFFGRGPRAQTSSSFFDADPCLPQTWVSSNGKILEVSLILVFRWDLRTGLVEDCVCKQGWPSFVLKESDFLLGFISIIFR